MFLHVSVILSTGVYDVTFCLWPHVPSGGGGGGDCPRGYGPRRDGPRECCGMVSGEYGSRGGYGPKQRGYGPSGGYGPRGLWFWGVMIRGVQYILPYPRYLHLVSATEAGGTHLTGMDSCFKFIPKYFTFFILQ